MRTADEVEVLAQPVREATESNTVLPPVGQHVGIHANVCRHPIKLSDARRWHERSVEREGRSPVSVACERLELVSGSAAIIPREVDCSRCDSDTENSVRSGRTEVGSY